MVMTLPRAVFAFQVRKSASAMGPLGTIGGIAFTWLSARRPKTALVLGVGMIGYYLYKQGQERARKRAAIGPLPTDLSNSNGAHDANVTEREPARLVPRP